MLSWRHVPTGDIKNGGLQSLLKTEFRFHPILIRFWSNLRLSAYIDKTFHLMYFLLMNIASLLFLCTENMKLIYLDYELTQYSKTL